MVPTSLLAPAPAHRHGLLRGNADLCYRLGVAVRVLAAIFGGYGVAALSTAVLALYLPATRAEAVLTATMVSFLIYPGAVMWVFAASSAARAWLGLLWLALPLCLLLLWGRL